MASRQKRAKQSAKKAGETATALRDNPYVQRLIEDDELRANIRTAFESARDAYGRMANGKGPAKALMDDKKVQKDLRQAAESLREASEQIRGKRKRKGLTFGRLLMLAIIGAIVVLVLSEDARKALLDKLFGPEEEFEYTSTTSQPAADQATAATSS
jgi:hypothetical protein